MNRSEARKSFEKAIMSRDCVLTPAAAIRSLRDIVRQDSCDQEASHGLRDRILEAVLRGLAPEVAEASLAAERAIGFWYA